MHNYCCQLKCFKSPDTHLDGVACVRCYAYNYCHCLCVTYMRENEGYIKIETEKAKLIRMKRKFLAYYDDNINRDLEYLEEIREHLINLRQLINTVDGESAVGNSS